MALEYVSPHFLRTVVTWVYTGILEFENGSKELGDNLPLAYDVYFWTEQYKTTSLRRTILDATITHFTTTGKIPEPFIVEYMHQTIPENSGLCKFVEDLFVARYTGSDRNEALTLGYVSAFPKNVLARIVVKLAKRSSPLKGEDILLLRNKCNYHGHKEGEDCNSST